MINNKSNIGRKLSEEQKLKISKSMKGKRNSLGTKRSKEFKQNLSNYWKNNREKHNFYIDGRFIAGTDRRIDMSRLEYRLWRQEVFKRDNWKCIECQTTKDIQADHIKPYSYYPELRYIISNGRTLCKDCHKKTDTYCSKVHKLFLDYSI